jgi:hypothetical protein
VDSGFQWDKYAVHWEMIKEILHTGRRFVIYPRNSKNFILKCRSTKISLLFLNLFGDEIKTLRAMLPAEIFYWGF